MTIALSIIFDSAYLEAALVTAYEAIKFEQFGIHKIYLVYLRKKHAADQEAEKILQAFCIRFLDRIPIIAITLVDSLPELRTHHFNNSIIYKALLPSILQEESYIMNLDAGILLGSRFGSFLQQVCLEYCLLTQDWVIAAHCWPVEQRVPAVLEKFPRNSIYPAGNMLLFNTTRYVQQRWQERYLGNYFAHAMHLEYAEQELICLTAHESELVALPDRELRLMEFLGTDLLLGKKTFVTPDMQNNLFHKFVGSFKPWKYWVLDPNKFIYIKRRSELESEFSLSGNPLVEAMRMSYEREEYVIGFLKAYDYYVQHFQG